MRKDVCIPATITQLNMADSQQPIQSFTLADVDVLFKRATAQHSAGHLVEAEGLYRQVLHYDADHADCLHMLGGLAMQTGRFDLAAELLGKAVALAGNVPEFHYNLATALTILGRPDESVDFYQSALAIKPGFVEAQCDLGDVLLSLGKLDEAIASYEQVLVLKPDMPDVLCKLGDTLQMHGRIAESIPHYERAIFVQPELSVALGNLGSALYRLERFGDAIERYEQLLAFDPNVPEVRCNLGNALYAQGRIEEAIVHYEVVLSLMPEFPKALCNLGDALLVLGRFAEAQARYEQALRIEPDIPEGLSNLGDALQGQGRLSEAIASYQRALRVKSDMPEALCNMGNACLNQGRVVEAIEHYRRALALKPGLRTAFSNLLMALHYAGEPSGTDILREALRCAELYRTDVSTPAFTNPLEPLRRLRIGYVSGDFCSHPVGYFIRNVLPNHSRSSFEVYCYSNGSSEDDLTVSLRAATDHWREIGRLSDLQVSDMIRSDCIDILVDLSGHTLGNRLLVFSARPAPVQVSWLGYFGTTGLPTMDYLIGDRFVTPESSAPEFVESIWRMPDSYLCFSVPSVDMAVRPPPSAHGAPFTFGCFSNLAKVSSQTIMMWASVLNETPRARLLLKAKGLDNPEVRQRILNQFASRGVLPHRIVFEAASSRQDYLAAYHRIDAILDTTPFSGGTTTAEALWMGVPVITLRGPTWAGRICESILSTVGLEQLVADSASQYAQIAIQLANDSGGLATLRSQLRPMMEASPFCDAKRFTSNLEVAYRSMWTRWCAQGLSTPMTSA